MSGRGARRAAETIIKILSSSGHEALLAGGCVRDLLLGRDPKDFDIATSALPDEICALFPRAQQVGAHFGVVVVRKYRHMVEVATFRTDGTYSDGRHPDSVTFGTARQDSRRRDFTINGMFFDPLEQRVIDYVGGQEDLQAGIVQAIGDPELRFEEDHLRMLRAVRFAACLSFHLEQDTFEAIYNRADRIALISRERIRLELERILSDEHRADGFSMLVDTGLIQHLWPQATWSTESLKRSAAALAALPPTASFTTAMVAMLHQLDSGRIDDVCRSLCCSNHTRREILWLAAAVQDGLEGAIRTNADLKLRMHHPAFAGMCDLLGAVLTAGGRSTEPAERLRTRADAVPADAVHPSPLIDGNDLLGLRLPPGPRFKQILDEVYYEQLNGNITTRQEALDAAQRMAKGV